MYPIFTGVSVDNQSSLTVQSLLDSQSLSSEAIPGATVVTTRPPSEYCVYSRYIDNVDFLSLRIL